MTNVRQIIEETLNSYYLFHHDSKRLVDEMETNVLRHLETLLSDQVCLTEGSNKPYRIMEVKGGFINEKD